MHHVASNLEASPGFEVGNQETLFYELPRPSLGPIFYLDEFWPTRQVLVTWVAVLSRSRQSLPRTPSRHPLKLEHHSGTRLLQSIEVASQSIRGLTPPLLSRPSVYWTTMADWCQMLPPVLRRAFASVHRGLHLLSPVHWRALACWQLLITPGEQWGRSIGSQKVLQEQDTTAQYHKTFICKSQIFYPNLHW